MYSFCSNYLYSVLSFSPVTASSAGSDAICNSSIVGEDGFDEGFPEVENFMHIIDLKSCDKVREP